MNQMQAEQFINDEIAKRRKAGEEIDGNTAVEIIRELEDNWSNYPTDAYELLYLNNVDTSMIDSAMTDGLISAILILAQE